MSEIEKSTHSTPWGKHNIQEGKERVTVIYTFLSRGRFNYNANLLIIIDRSNILDDWLMFTFSK